LKIIPLIKSRTVLEAKLIMTEMDYNLLNKKEIYECILKISKGEGKALFYSRMPTNKYRRNDC